MSTRTPSGTAAVAPPAPRVASMWRQPKAVWAVAFACVIAFMGIGLVDPILKPIGAQLHASASQVSLLFTSYMVVIAIAMIITGFVSSRLGAKRTLLLGLAIIIVGSVLAGMSGSVGAIVGWRGLWGLGNALFIATALSTIVVSAKGSVAQAIILYEAALGVGIAIGPLLGGVLGNISWRGPFFGVGVLMAIALISTAFLLPQTGERPRPARLSEPFKALRHKGLLSMAITALLYNFGFFTLLAFTPFVLTGVGAIQIGLVFCGWGLMLAVSSVFVAPVLQRRFGTLRSVIGSLSLFAVLLAVMALGTGSNALLIVCVVLAGVFLGINNTLVTEIVMKVAPVERPVASAAYSFVRFGGGAIAPWLAGKLGEEVSPHLPFWVGAATVLAGAVLLVGARGFFGQIQDEDRRDSRRRVVQ